MDGTIDVEVREPAAPVPNQATTPMRVAFDRATTRRERRSLSRQPGGRAAIGRNGRDHRRPGRVDQFVEIAVPATADPTRPDDRRRRRHARPGPGRPHRCRAMCCAARDDLIGRQAARVLAGAGRPARAGDLVAPWLVRRGDDASIVFRRGGLQIASATEVLDNGRAGEFDPGAQRRQRRDAPRRGRRPPPGRGHDQPCRDREELAHALGAVAVLILLLARRLHGGGAAGRDRPAARL